MAFTVPQSGNRIASTLKQVLTQIKVALEERYARIYDTPDDWPATISITPTSSVRIVDACAHYVETVRDGLSAILGVQGTSDSPIEKGFFKSDGSAWSDINEVLTAAGYASGWDNDFRVVNRNIWVQIQQVMEQLTVYASTAENPSEFPDYWNNCERIGGASSFAYGTVQAAWEGMFDNPQYEPPDETPGSGYPFYLVHIHPLVGPQYMATTHGIRWNFDIPDTAGTPVAARALVLRNVGPQHSIPQPLVLTQEIEVSIEGFAHVFETGSYTGNVPLYINQPITPRYPLYVESELIQVAKTPYPFQADLGSGLENIPSSIVLQPSWAYLYRALSVGDGLTYG